MRKRECLPKGEPNLQQNDGHDTHETAKGADDVLAHPHDGLACAGHVPLEHPHIAMQPMLGEVSQCTDALCLPAVSKTCTPKYKYPAVFS